MLIVCDCDLRPTENKIIGSESTICKMVGERKQSDLFSTCSFCIENCEIRIQNAISPTVTRIRKQEGH